MSTLAERFEALVDRSGEHHVWLGAVDRQDTPQIRVDGRLTTARRVAWRLAHGPLPAGARIGSCPDDPRCVRVTHLHLGRRPRPPLAQLSAQAPAGRRARQDSGTLREVRAGVWKLTVRVPGNGRISRTVTASAEDARRQLAALAVEVRGGARTLDALVTAYLAHLHDCGRAAETLRRYEQVWRAWLSPTLGRIAPDLVARTHIERVLAEMAAAGLSTSSIRQATTVIASAIEWARERADVAHNPAVGAHLPDGGRIARPRHRS